MSSESNPTLHKVLPILLALDKCIADSEDDPTSISAVKAKMKLELEKRTQDTDSFTSLYIESLHKKPTVSGCCSPNQVTGTLRTTMP